ncbi:MAG: retropepsin-like aspartic protease, partial [Candidatus Saccharimonadales bacterium]
THDPAPDKGTTGNTPYGEGLNGKSGQPQYKLASNVQKDFDSSKFAQRILDQNVSIKMRELVPALSQAVQKSLIDELKPHRVHFDERKTYAGFQEPLFYNLPIGRVKATVHGLPMDIVLDRGSEINVMTVKAFETCRAAINRGRRIRMHDINGGSSEMLGVCEAVEIEIGGITTYAHLNVGGTQGDFDVLLGQPWFHHARTTWEDRDDGSWLTIRDPHCKSRIVEILTAPIPNDCSNNTASVNMAKIEAVTLEQPNSKSAECTAATMGEGIEDFQVLYILDTLGSVEEHNVYVYKPVARKVKPIPGILPEEARTIKRIPEDPVKKLTKAIN